MADLDRLGVGNLFLGPVPILNHLIRRLHIDDLLPRHLDGGRATGPSPGQSLSAMAPITSMLSMATTVSMEMETKEMLRAFGAKGETYDEIIRRLIREAGWKRLDARWNRILQDDKFIPLKDL